MEAINLNELLQSRQKYNDVLKSIYDDVIAGDIENRRIQRQFIIDNEYISLATGRIYVNMLLFSMFIEKNITIHKQDLFMDTNLTPNTLSKAFNKLLEIAIANGFTYHEYSQALCNIHDMMTDSFSKTNTKSGVSLDLVDFIITEANDPNARRLMNISLKNNLQFDEIETVFNTLSSLLESYLSTKEIGISKLLRPKTGINAKQMAQSFAMVGLKPDIDGSIINHVIESSYYHGLQNDTEFFIDCKGTRNALITNHNMVSVSGYLTQKLTLLLMDLILSETTDDCKSAHPIRYVIDSKDKLAFIDDRYYHPIVDGKIDFETLKYININDESSKKLIGQTIALRSPATCCADGDGKHVCPICYGKRLYEINKDKHAGILAVLFLTEILTQMLLSAKHLLTTRARKIEWSDLIKDNFIISYDRIMFNEDTDAKIEISSLTVDDYDDDMDSYVVNKFNITVNGEKIEYNTPITLYLNGEFVDETSLMVDSEPIIIDSAKIAKNNDESPTYIFKFIQSNSSLSTALLSIIDLIDNSNHMGCETYDEMVNKFAELLLASGITANTINLVHCEMIINELLYKADTTEKIDWSKYDIGAYDILRVSRAVLNMPLSISLSFERLATQLSDLATYSKDGTSIYDRIFR